MQAERIVERSGSRELRRILKKLEEDRRLLREIGAIASRVSVIVGGIFFPSELGRGDIPIAEVKIPRQIKKLRTPNVPELGRIDRPELEPVEVPDFQRRALREVQTPAPRSSRQPARTRAPGPQRQPVPAPTGAVGQILRRIGVGVLASSAISQAIRSRGSRTTQPFIDPVFPPQGIPTPLTPAQPTPLPSPQPFRPRTQEDVCRDLAKRRRKKRRKCDQRENVVWAGGPSKGKIAGSKCFKFQG